MAVEPIRSGEGDGALALSRMPRDLAVLKIENENMMALAAAHPRNHAAILAEIKTQLQTYREFAEEAMYAKPVGKDPNTGQMKYARGLSVRSAESLAEAYGFNKVRVDVSVVDADTVKLNASFTDFQKGKVWEASAFVSKRYKRANGSMGYHSDGRFFNVVVKAEGSKLIREVITRSVSPGLRKALERLIDEQLDSFLDEKTQEKLVAQFSTKGVTKEMLEKHVGKSVSAFTKADRKTLIAVWTALADGETTVAELFQAAAGEEAKAPPVAEDKPRGQKIADRVKQAPDNQGPGPDEPSLSSAEAPAPADDDAPPAEPEAAPEYPETALADLAGMIGEGDRFSTCGRTQGFRAYKTKTDKPYLKVSLYQGTTIVQFTKWGPAPDWLRTDAAVLISRGRGDKTYQGTPQFVIEEWQLDREAEQPGE